jgi:hypothetical protein
VHSLQHVRIPQVNKTVTCLAPFDRSACITPLHHRIHNRPAPRRLQLVNPVAPHRGRLTRYATVGSWNGVMGYSRICCASVKRALQLVAPHPPAPLAAIVPSYGTCCMCAPDLRISPVKREAEKNWGDFRPSCQGSSSYLLP